MTRRRWIADQVDLKDQRAWLLGDQARHLARVLRAQPGQEFDLVLPGTEPTKKPDVRLGRIISVADSRVEFALGNEVSTARSCAPQITLLLAVFKFDRMEWALEKAVELGVARIIPVLARRTEKHLALAAGKRIERWRRLALQAAQQSRRSDVPEIATPMRLEDALTIGTGLKIVLTEQAEPQPLAQILQTSSATKEITLAVGPEGGWSSDEQSMFFQHGWTPASLGVNILRAETAVIGALAVSLLQPAPR